MRRALRFVLCTTATLACSLSLQLLAAQSADSGSAVKPADAGRARINLYLDRIATQFTAKRAEKVAAIHTRAQADARQSQVRREILMLLGKLPERTPLRAQVTGETQAGGFTIRKVLFESQPGLRVTALLYLPSGQTANGKRPAILMTPGHYPTSKDHDAAQAALFAMNGFVVLSYDPIGMGERLEYPDPAKPGSSLAGAPTGEHAEASLQPMLIGDTLARYFVWDAMRGVDYLAQLPEVDPKRIGAFGCSGGGTVTAMVAALDPRVAAAAVACYMTSFDELLPSKGPQEAEQSDPRFISAGLDFPDWIELAAPRPYAVVSTYSDMFPFAGARSTVIEARKFYSLFDPASEGEPEPGGVSGGIPPTPTGPAWNADTTNRVSPQAMLQFITGPGRHGALAPIMGQIVSFFMRNLEPGSDADNPKIPPGYLSTGPGNPMEKLPKSTYQVTPTGQVSSSYPDEATVFSLNRQRAGSVVHAGRSGPAGQALTTAIRVTAFPKATPHATGYAESLLTQTAGPIALAGNAGDEFDGQISAPKSGGRHPAVLFLVPDSIDGAGEIARANKARFDALAAAGNVVLAITPRPSPPGNDDMKSPLLGPFYLLSLRADLVGRTLLGLRIDDVIRAMDYLSSRADVDTRKISAIGSGHMGLVLLHAAVLDSRIRHVEVDHVLKSYRSLVDAPMPIGAREDVVPGVLLRYDIPDLVRALGPRLTATDWLEGTQDLSQTSTPLDTLKAPRP